MKLTIAEDKEYKKIVNSVIPTLLPGDTYYPKDLFKDRPCNPRIVRHLREEIIAKSLPLALVGDKISDGIIHLQLS